LEEWWALERRIKSLIVRRHNSPTDKFCFLQTKRYLQIWYGIHSEARVILHSGDSTSVWVSEPTSSSEGENGDQHWTLHPRGPVFALPESDLRGLAVSQRANLILATAVQLALAPSLD
jgi:hypothetical protein